MPSPACAHHAFWRTALCAVIAVACWVAAAGPGNAAEDRCVAVSRAPGEPSVRKARYSAGSSIVPAQFIPPKAPNEAIRITFVGHSTFVIESRQGVKIATDYNDYIRPAELPDIATMNRAHTSHFTDQPDPLIPNVLRGWNPAGGPARHDLTVKDVRVRNLPTNIRSYASGGTDEFGNSIFIFEMGALCIAHLGHLHHTLSPRQIGQIGVMDVVLAPVDGSYTLDTPGMIEVLKALKAPLIIPMHYFSSFTLDRFLETARADFEIETSTTASITVTRSTLPRKPKVLVLPGS
ncbi:MAG: MBL fold metallo-hydrolase [Hyphomicrobiaceae bacterium]